MERLREHTSARVKMVAFAICVLTTGSFFFALPAYAVSYCGQISGQFQGGYGDTQNVNTNLLSNIAVKVNGVAVPLVTDLNRPYGDADVSPPGDSHTGSITVATSTVTLSGTVYSGRAGYNPSNPNGSGSCPDWGTVDDVRLTVNGRAEENCNASPAPFTCTYSNNTHFFKGNWVTDWSAVDFSKTLALTPGANTIIFSSHHAYACTRANSCMIGTAPFRDGAETSAVGGPAAAKITIIYNPPPPPVNANGVLTMQCKGWPNPYFTATYTKPSPLPRTPWTWAYQMGTNNSANLLLCSSNITFNNGPYGTACGAGTSWWQWMPASYDSQSSIVVPASMVVPNQYYTLRVKADSTHSTTTVVGPLTLQATQCNCGGGCSPPPPPRSAPPTLTLSASPSTVAAGADTTLTWSSTDATSCTGSGGFGSWPGFKPLNGTFDAGPMVSNKTFTLSCSGPGGTVTRSAAVAVVTPPPTPTPIVIPAGRIMGQCVGWPSPHIEIRWSATPPAGSLPPNSNSVLRAADGSEAAWFFAGSFPGVDGTRIDGTSAPAWGTGGYPNPNYEVHDLRDDSVIVGHTYSYFAKYRPESPTNTFDVFVSAANCGGPAGAPIPLSISPATQTIPPNITAILTATGGDGTYSWSAPGADITGFGPQIGVTYLNSSTSSITKTVTVTSGSQSASATVRVEGVQTFQDSIEMLALGNRYVLINNDDAYTSQAAVNLTLSHGFAGVADSDVTVRLSNILADVSTAPQQLFHTGMPWNICAGTGGCIQGLHTVFAIFKTSNGAQSAVVMDNITYLAQSTDGISSVKINDDAPTTPDRQVTLALQHGFIGPSDDEVSMQIANSILLLDDAAPVLYAPAVSWDICNGAGMQCANGAKTVYVKFCALGTCKTVVFDDINLQSAWPDWGVRINNDDDFSLTSAVQLRLNPWFNKPGTTIQVSNLGDMSDAEPQSYADLVPWDFCYHQPGPCSPDVYAVYVKYSNPSVGTWPASDSPRYQDDILYPAAACLPRPLCLDASPACSIAEPIGGWCPAGFRAGVLIDDGSSVTTSRFVKVTFKNPFGTTAGVSMRPINDGQLTFRDRDIIDNQLKGGVDSQGTPTSAPTLQRGDTRNPTTAQDVGTATPARQSQLIVSGDAVTRIVPELESGTPRTFVPSLSGWDLCQGKVDCPYGTYKVLVQYYLTPQTSATSTTRAAIGDEVSEVYYDTVDYGAPTQTPTPTPTPSITPTESNPLITPTDLNPGGPGSGAGIVPGWIASFFQSLAQTLAGAANVISPLALASAIAVLASALAVILPLIGPGLGAFLYQWFMGVMGLLPKRKKTWGTVYDANTKRPIPFAKVQLLDRNKRVLEIRIADKEGRYGFLTTPESLMAQNTHVYILPSQAGYVFPSHTPASIDTFVYNNLYYGALIEVNDKTLINFDIPLDPVRPSSAPLMVKSPSIALGAIVAAIADAGFWLGLVMVPLNFILEPNPFTFGILCLFLGTASLRLFGISEHPFGVVKDAATGRPMPFALITLNDMTGQRKAFAVSDELGRYFIVVPQGTYELTVFTPAIITPPRQTKMSISAKKGWVTRELKV